MFERYTDNARKVIFFARHRAGKGGSPSIECGHLLLAALEQSGTMFFAAGLQGPAEHLADDIKKELPPAASPIPSDVDMPVSSESVKALNTAIAEADRLKSSQVNLAHLPLGLMLECPKLKEILNRHGIDASRVAQIAQQVDRA